MPAPGHPVTPRHTVAVKVGHVTVGGSAPVVVQSKTNTDTADVDATVKQVRELAHAGSELVRITVNSEDAARAVPDIVRQLEQAGEDIPLVGDFHFNGHKLLANHPDCARLLAKYRINPGNVGRGRKKDEQFAAMIGFAIEYDKPVRIGVNWGSLDQALVARLMDENAQRLATMVDSGNGISWGLPFGEWLFINSDLTMYLLRRPVGDWFALEAVSHYDRGGRGIAEARLFDEHGYLGRSHQALFVDRLVR